VPPALHSADTVPESVKALTTAHSGNSPTFFRTVARWGVQAAEALEHAHKYGVVHRDIKPSNLLVDGAGQLWVTDFGLAQFQSDAGLTLTGDLLGTLRYMSPEQALAKRGVVDHRSDIYSLGATLYELLTLEPAFGGRDREELLRQIAFEEPRPLRRRNPAIPADLETIVGKAMAKAVEERYATALDLAEDLRRFLEHRPIKARRPTLYQRTSKWSRRHRAVVTTAVVALSLAAVGFATSTALIAQAYKETKSAYDGEAQQRKRAEENFRQARRVIDSLARFSEEELSDHPLLQDIRRRLLENALDYYQDFLEEHADDPTIKADLTASRARVAQILKELSTLHGTTLLSILQDRRAQEDLKLNAEQKQRVAQLVNQFSQQWGRAYFPPPPFKGREPPKKGSSERKPPTPEATRAVEQAIAELLRPEQNRRFRQIALQVQQQGLYGFSDPGVVDALKLTSKQREQIRKRQRESHRSCEDHMFKGKERGVPEEFWEGVQDRILGVLTPEQRARWRELTGEPIRLDIHYGYPFDGRESRMKKKGPHHHD
jgi:serine/threonine protein kinase